MSQDQAPQPKRNTLGVNKAAASQPSARRKPVRPGGKPKARPPQDEFYAKPGKKFSRPEGAKGAKPTGKRPPRPDGGSFGDRPPRRDGAGFGDRPPRRGGAGFGDRAPRRDGAGFGDRPPRRDNFEQDARPPRNESGGVSEFVKLAKQRALALGASSASAPAGAARKETAKPAQQAAHEHDEAHKDERHAQQPVAAEFIASEPIVLQTEDLKIFLPCAAGVQDLLAAEIARITGQSIDDFRITRGGIALLGSWNDVMLLNLHSRLAVRVMVAVAHDYYSNEADLYTVAHAVPWHAWFKNTQTFKIELTSQNSGLQSTNFAALKIKDAVVDSFREHTGARPNVDTHQPQVRLHAHLTQDEVILYIDTAGDSLFKRGWRQDAGDAPLKETLAAALLAASGWSPDVLLYDPCCGSGTIAIEAAQIAANIAPGSLRSFGFEKLSPFVRADWLAIKNKAAQAVLAPPTVENITIFGSDVAHRMVDFAQRNAERAGVAAFIEFRGGDALQRKPPCEQKGMVLLNPPYGERIETGGFSADEDDFFSRLASHWKEHFDGWTAWVLSPDLKLPGRMRLAESRKVPLWNGPIECRLFKFEVQGKKTPTVEA